MTPAARPSMLIALAVAAAACSDGGTGAAKFTTWGEGYIMDGIPPDPSGS